MALHDTRTDPAHLVAEPLSVEGRLMKGGIAQRLFGVDPDPAALGRFRLLEVLGRGAMGVVYKAYDPQLDRPVAVKVVSVPSDVAAKRLIREAKALARLSHPHVVTIYEAGEVEGEVFVAMEFVDGGSLSTWIGEHAGGGRARLAAVMQFALQAVDGLAAAHDLGLVHRDIKPANVLIGIDGRLRLADFGLARSGPQVAEESTTSTQDLDPAVSLTLSGSAVGTPAYMSPEQFGGEADARSDQFGLCATLYEAFYGVRAFEGSSMVELQDAIAQRRVTKQQDGSVPDYVRRALLRGMSPVPEHRFSDVRALGRALRTGQHRRRLAVGGGLVVAGALGVAAFALLSREPSCTDGRERISGLADASMRTQLDAAIRATGRPHPGELMERVGANLDEMVDSWSGQNLAACIQTRDADPEIAAQARDRQACLEGALETVDTTLATIAPLTAEEANIVPHTLDFLLDVVDCHDADRDTYGTELGLELIAEYRRGKAAETRADYKPAIEAYENVLARAPKGQLPRLRAETHIRLSDMYASHGKAELNREHLVAALDDAENADDHALVAAGWIHLAEDLPAGTDWSTVELLLARARRIVDGEELGPRARAHLEFFEGRMLLKRGRGEEAVEHIHNAIELGTPIGHPQLAHMYNTLSNVMQLVGDMDAALEASEQSEQVMTRELGPHHPDVATLKIRTAEIQGFAGREDQAILTLDAAIEVLDATPDYMTDNLSLAYSSRAVGKRNVGRFEESLRDHARALELAPDRAGDIYASMAHTYRMMKRHEEALGYADKAIGLLKGHDIWERMTLVDCQLVRAGMLAALDRDEDSAAQLRELRPAFDEVFEPSTVGHMQASLQLSEVLTDLENYEEALAVIEPYLSGALEGDRLWVGILQVRKAEVHRERGDESLAREWALTARGTLREAGAGDYEIARVEEILAELDSQQ